MVVDRWVPEVDGERVVAVLGADRPESRPRQRDRLAPANRLERVGCGPTHGLAQAIGIVMQRRQRNALRASVALGERIVAVRPRRQHAGVLDLEGQAAAGLAERAGPEDQLGGHKVRTLPRSAAREHLTAHKLPVLVPAARRLHRRGIRKPLAS